MDEEKIRKNKLAYIKMNLDKLCIEIDRLEYDLQEASAGNRIKFENSLRRLKKKRDQAAEQYEALKVTNGNSFEAIRNSVVNAWRDLASGVESAKNSFTNSL